MKKYFHYFVTLELKPLLFSLVKTGGTFFILMFALNFMDKYLFGESFDIAMQSSISIWLALLKGALLISLVPMVFRAFSKRRYLENHVLTSSNYKVIHKNWEKQ